MLVSDPLPPSLRNKEVKRLDKSWRNYANLKNVCKYFSYIMTSQLLKFHLGHLTLLPYTGQRQMRYGTWGFLFIRELVV